ncbi:alpha/beta hydrolase [Lactobacillus sp. ESL0791]|uniref:alpha/beta fold hydrolase n=1 Tax=Lactobacillus sp. ESL0791 TaxID=2983234 RepID=UPI0023F988A7|nr:alpha/beta hydrolase [Lactobacillus sp. ESL0791]MDF7638991.1 alpha/beta hydrolase [Lactobacillus sp. ESL0791]
MYFTTSDNVKLYYTDTAEKDKPVLLAIPGIGGALHMWDQAVKLFKADFRIILFNPRNQGRSQRTYKGQRIARHGADLHELLCYLHLKKVIGIGNSMGAAILWAYQSLFGAEPFAAIIDLDQPPKMVAEDSWHYGFKDLTWANYPDYLKVASGPAFYAHIDDEMFAQAKEEQEKYPCYPADNYQCRINHAQEDWRDVLMDCRLPQLVLAGKNSPFFDYHFVTAVKKLNEQISTAVIPHCGHLIQAEQPQLMYDTVMRFLRENKLP